MFDQAALGADLDSVLDLHMPTTTSASPLDFFDLDADEDIVLIIFPP